MISSGTLWAYGLSAGAVLLLGAGACVLHRLRSGASSADYVYGGATWLITVAVKVVLAIVVLGGLHVAFKGKVPLILTMLMTGCLTGATECVGTLLVAKMKRWRTASWDSTVAFGLAFGCFEAILLATMILLGVMGLSSPESLKPEHLQAAMESFSDPYRPLTFIIERIIAVAVHLLSSVLIIRAVQIRKISLFWWGFFLKSLLDAVPPENLPMLILQGIYILFGVFSFVAFLRYSRSVNAHAGAL